MSIDASSSVWTAPSEAALPSNQSVTGDSGDYSVAGYVTPESLDASRSFLEETSSQPGVLPESVGVGAEQTCGVSNVVSQLGTGAWTELTEHYDRVIGNGIAGGVLGVATKIGLETAKKSTYGVLAAAGIYGVYELGCALPGWKHSAAIAYNPLGYDISEVRKAEQHIQSLGGGAVDLIAGGAAGGAGVAYGGPFVAPAKSLFSATGRTLTTTRNAFLGSSTKTAGTEAVSASAESVAANTEGMSAGAASDPPWMIPGIREDIAAHHKRLVAEGRVGETDEYRWFSPDGKDKVFSPKGPVEDISNLSVSDVIASLPKMELQLSEQSIKVLSEPMMINGKSVPPQFEVFKSRFVTSPEQGAALANAKEVKVIGYGTDTSGWEVLQLQVDGQKFLPGKDGFPILLVRSNGPQDIHGYEYAVWSIGRDRASGTIAPDVYPNIAEFQELPAHEQVILRFAPSEN